MGPREQSNLVSSYLDASSIYGNSLNLIQKKILGSSNDELQKLRKSGSAKLLTSSTANSDIKDLLLATDNRSADYCQSESPKNKCFQSGTTDVNLLPGIAAIHTLFMRQHNHLVDKLKVS